LSLAGAGVAFAGDFLVARGQERVYGSVAMTTANTVPRIGVVFRPQLPPERLPGFAAAAEAAGLDDLWLWEDCFAEGGLGCAAAALAWTSTLRIGLGLMPAPLRNPALAAMEIAALARMFPGRFVPAAGHGVTRWMSQVGASVASPMTLLREWVNATRALLHAETVTAHGVYVRLDQVRLDWPPASVPPVLVGARGPRTLALAGQIADGLVLDSGLTPDGVRAAVALAAAAGESQAVAAAGPQEVAVGGPREVAAGSPQGAAAAGIGEVVVYLPCAAGPGARQRLEAELRPERGSGPERAAAGSPREVADAILAFSAAGATTVVLQPDGADPDAGATLALIAEASTIARQDRA
jgi:alkanesulfonate monooxygenase SsuD/methylene tetrahydromethanopterin reductase-like flavin-dependent oxidoreductase (luciferase family)